MCLGVFYGFSSIDNLIYIHVRGRIQEGWGVYPPHTHRDKSSSPRREFSRSLALGIGQIPPFSFPAREEPTHTRHWGKGSPALERPSRPPPLFMGWVTKKKPKTTLLTYDPILLSCVAGWLVGVHTPPHPPPSGRERRQKGKNLPKTKSPESLARSLQHSSTTYSGQVDTSPLVISSEYSLHFSFS